MKIVLNKILVPLDFSQASKDALDYAVHISKIYGSEVELLHVVETYEFNSSYRDESTAREIIEQGIRAKFDDIVSELDAEDVKFSYAYRTGKIYRQIDFHATETAANLIVMGTHGASENTGDIAKFMLGTNANRVVHQASCPVLTVKNKEHDINFKKILLPLDITKATRQKVAQAIEIAKTFNSEIHLLAVSSYVDNFQEDANFLELRLKEVADEVAAEGIKVFKCIERNESPAHAIKEYSRINDIDLTVIMTKQEKKWDEFLLGSQAKKVITQSDTPVLSLQPRKG